MKKGRNTVFSTAPSNNRILQDTGNFVFDDNPLTIFILVYIIRIYTESNIWSFK